MKDSEPISLRSHLLAVGTTVLERRAPEGSIRSYSANQVIKRPGDEGTLLIVRCGSVRLERDVISGETPQTMTIAVYGKGEPLNYARDFANDANDVSNRLVAQTDGTQVLILSPEFLRGKKVIESEARRFLTAVARHADELTESLVYGFEERLESARKNRELESQLEIANAALEEKDAELAELRKQRDESQRAQMQTANDALQTILAWSEESAKSAIRSLNAFILLTVELGISLSQEQIEHVRQRMHDMLPKLPQGQVDKLLSVLFPED